MADHHRADLVVDALHMTHGRGRLEAGCIAHSNRGSEYTSAQLRNIINELGMRASTGRTGSCYGNATAESFWAILKAEIGTRAWPDRTTARAEVFSYIETFYNRCRLRKHPHWGYLPPTRSDNDTTSPRKNECPTPRGNFKARSPGAIRLVDGDGMRFGYTRNPTCCVLGSL